MALKTFKHAGPKQGGETILIYGPQDIGKTETAIRLAATSLSPDPKVQAYVVRFEAKGASQTRLAHDFTVVTSLDEFVEVSDDLARVPNHVIVLDSLSVLVNQEVAEMHQEKVTWDGKTSLKYKDPRLAFAPVTDKVKAAVGKLLSTNKVVIMTAHHKTFDAKAFASDLDVDDKKKWGEGNKQVVAPDCHPRIAKYLLENFRFVWYAYRPLSDSGQRVDPNWPNTYMITSQLEAEKYRVLSKSSGASFSQKMLMNADHIAARFAEHYGVVPPPPAPAKKVEPTVKAPETPKQPWETWDKDAAYAFAVEAGKVADVDAARDLFKTLVVDQFGSKYSTVNSAEVHKSFYELLLLLPVLSAEEVATEEAPPV